MPFCLSVDVSFADCPDCVEEFELLSEILHNASSNIEGVLQGSGIPYRRKGDRLIEANFGCGANCTFHWKDGFADVKYWNC